ncbi:MAG: two-component regulator propeller domain-containing protein [Candidatus Aminicenantes bacterium]|jgi:two-component sensor histidine kinase
MNETQGNSRAILHIFTLTVILAWISSDLYSQEYVKRTYTIDDGLASPTIYDITQDIKGRMWVATPKGVTCYDGTTWKNYSTSNGLPFESYYKIQADKQGNIWAFTNNVNDGISLFNSKIKQWRHISGPNHKNKNPQKKFISSIAIMENRQTLYIGIGIKGPKKMGFYIYAKKNEESPDEKEHWTHSGFIPIFGTDSYNGSFYLATGQGLFRVNPDHPHDWKPENPNTPSSSIHSVAVEKKQEQVRLWLMGKEWVGYWAPVQDYFHLLYQGSIPGFKGDYHYDHLVTLPDGFGGLWVGSKFSFIQVVPGAPESSHSSRIITPLGITGGYSIFYDRESNLWVGTFRGAEKITNFCFENYKRTSGFYDDEVTAIQEFGNGNMAFGHNGGFTFLINNRIYPVEIPGIDKKVRLTARVQDMCRDQQGNVWAAASYRGIVKISPTWPIKMKWYKNIIPGSLHNYASSVLVDNQGNLWVGINDRLFKWQNNDFISPHPPVKVNSNVRRLFSGSSGKIYIATGSSGLYRRQKGILEHILPAEDDLSQSVYAVYEDKSGALLVGTGSGLFILRGKELTAFHPGRFRVDYPVYFIREDHQGNLWIGLNNGVIRWDRTHGGHARHYTKEDGLVGNETNRAAGFVDSSGRVWIGTESGASCYFQERDQLKQVPPQLELLYLEAAGTTYSLDRDITLEHHQDDLIFYFRGISFIDEKAVGYNLKLEGFDQQWSINIRPTNNQIRYTNLSPGNYRFHVQAVNKLGIKSALMSSGVITIKKPFHQTWAFYFLLLVGLVFLVYLVANFISKKRYADQLEEQVQKRTAQLESSQRQLKKSLQEKEILLKEIHHRVKNNLQVISSLLDLQADTLDIPQDSKIIQVFEESKNRIRSMTLIHENLYQTKDLVRINVPEYIRELVAHFISSYGNLMKKITPRIHVDHISLNMDTAIPIGLILSELISNAFKHAFPPGKEGEIRISLYSPSKGTAVLRVSDNGVGLPRDMEVSQNQSLGLQLVTLLTQQVKGTLEMEGSSGTTVTITFPYIPPGQEIENRQ